MEINKKIIEDIFPQSEEMFGWIHDLTQWGHRKTGTPEGKKSADYIASKMKEFGLEDVVIEKVPSMCMTVNECHLIVDDEAIESFYINGTNRQKKSGAFEMAPKTGKQEFVYLRAGLEEDFAGIDVEGKIVVCDIFFHGQNPKDLMNWNGRSEVYDPDGKMNSQRNKYDIYSPNNWPFNYYFAQKKGAVGFIGILENYMDCYYYNEDYTEIGLNYGVEYMSIPGMWISKKDGDGIKIKFQKEKSLCGTMMMKSNYEYKDALNVHGRLKGLSSDYILIHSHHDAVFSGAVQDASGISEMLALAKYFSQVPMEARKKSLMFAATDTHYTDYMGHQGFIKKRQEVGDDILIDIAIEHIGKEVELNEKNEAMETGEVECRLLYVTDSSGLLEIVKSIFEKYNLEKTIFFPVADKKTDTDQLYEFKQDEIISDAYYFGESGLPVVSMVSGEMYLFHPSDMPDRIPVQELRPVGMAFAEIVNAAADNF